MKSESNKQIDLRRAALIELSVKARAYREEQLHKAETEQQLLFWSSIRINDIIAGWYRETSGATEFKTFAQWKADGYNIKKGSKAFILWSKKKSVTKPGEAQKIIQSQQKRHTNFFLSLTCFPIYKSKKQRKEGNNAN